MTGLLMGCRLIGLEDGAKDFDFNMKHIQDSPIDKRRKELPRGNAEWKSYAHVYANIAKGCESMARTKYVYLSDEHINAMAVLGCGDENTMKYEQTRMRDRGFI